jgi:tetratricopeptide (TPR) repeat protein/tRNA A-37 threonylcarbamoyl transferase component Bud32/TolB-like protein
VRSPLPHELPLSADLRDQLQASLGTAYTIERELGGGGMSRVFAATETALERRVVVKILPPEMAEGVSVERFKREIQLAAQLRHPHIVPVLAAGVSGGLPYYTMPLEDGHSLRARLAKSGPLPITEAISVLRDVAKALAYAHERGVVHRDIKPDNVLLTGGAAVVTDFGVAKALSAAKVSTHGATLTQIGTSLGTPAYMAPEQAAADTNADHRVDLYAFGVMAYELLAGIPPFHGKQGQKLLAAQMGERPVPIDELRPDTPPLLAQLVMRCLEKDPNDRPQSASDLLRVLETVTSGGGHPAMPEILLGGRRRLWRALTLYAMAFVAVAILAKAAIISIGLPDWVFPGALVVMALGLPVILFTAFVHHGTYQALTASALTPGGSPVTHSTMTRLAVKASPWVSWRKTALGGFIALGAFAVLVLAFMVMRAFGIGPAGSLLASGKLKANEQLLVADFQAPGSDTSLGSAVTEAVRTDLGQSSVVSVMASSAVGAALARMQRPATSRLDLPLAREVAQREGVKAVVDGTIHQLGGGFLVALRLVAAESGDELASFHETIDGPKELIPAVDKLTRQLRGKMGESLKSVRANPALEQVTTPSLEALKQYAIGARTSDLESDYPKAIALLTEAVALDTTFAMAYRKLGVALANNGMPREQYDSAFERAYRYRDRLTDRERYLAIGSYEQQGPGRDRRKAVAAFEALLQRDSVDHIALNNLGLLLVSRREMARAESLFLRSIVSGRSGVQEHANLVFTQLSMGETAQAESSFARARKQYPGASEVATLDAPILYARGRVDSTSEALRKMRAGASDPGNRAWATQRLGDLELLRGRLAASERDASDARAQDSSRGAPEPPLGAAMDSAWVDMWFREQPARSIQLLDAALAHTPLRSLKTYDRPYLHAAQLYALAGRPERARGLLAQYAADVKDSALIREQEPERHNALAEIALAERRPLDAVAEFKEGDRLPDGPADACTGCLPARLGRAYDQANMPDSTLAMYERYVSLPQFLGPFPLLDAAVLAGIHKRLGELYEAKGDRNKALSHYLAFVALWKDADPELQPKVAEVKQRIAHLHDVERR